MNTNNNNTSNKPDNKSQEGVKKTADHIVKPDTKPANNIMRPAQKPASTHTK